MASTGSSGSFTRPGSPWIPMPISISSSSSAKLGSPACGTVHARMATPMLLTCPITRSAIAATASRSSPRSAAAPAMRSTSTVPATPRRPAV